MGMRWALLKDVFIDILELFLLKFYVFRSYIFLLSEVFLLIFSLFFIVENKIKFLILSFINRKDQFCLKRSAWILNKDILRIIISIDFLMCFKPLRKCLRQIVNWYIVRSYRSQTKITQNILNGGKCIVYFSFLSFQSFFDEI